MVGRRQSLGPSWAGTRVCVLASAQLNLLVARAGAQNWLLQAALGVQAASLTSLARCLQPHPALLISVPLGEQAAL